MVFEEGTEDDYQDFDFQIGFRSVGLSSLSDTSLTPCDNTSPRRDLVCLASAERISRWREWRQGAANSQMTACFTLSRDFRASVERVNRLDLSIHIASSTQSVLEAIPDLSY